MARMRNLRATAGADTDTRDIARELEHLESTLAARAASVVHRSGGEVNGADKSEKALQALDSEIDAVRASLCLEQGMSDADCKSFMRRACSSNSATKPSLPPDDVGKTGVTPQMCQQFFLDHRTIKAKQNASSRKGAKARAKPAEAVASEPEEKTATEPGPKEVYDKAPTKEGSGNGTILGGKEERPLPSQGYNEYDGGRLVEHDDNKTVTGDWMREFGVNAGHRDVYTICKEHPDNEWCRLHSYHEPRPAHADSYRIDCPRLILVATAALLAYP